MKTLILVITTLFYFSSPMPTHANDSIITKDLIIEKNEKMQELLAKREPVQTIQFLHENINDSALFNIEYSNPTLPAAKTTNNFQMNKQDYINSFITGMHYVDNYHVSIKTHNIAISPDQKMAVVTEIMTEEGTMLNAHDPLKTGLPFSSTTNCTTRYKIIEGTMQSEQANCKTSTAEINSI